MKNLRLMEIILTLEQGGAQQLLLYKLRQLKQTGCTTVVVSFEDGPVRLALEAEGIPVILIIPKRARILNIPYFFAELYRIQHQVQSVIETYQINIMQTHLLNVYDFICANIRRTHPTLKALVWTFHNTRFEIEQHDRLSVKMPIYRYLYRQMAKHCDAIIAVSNDVQTAIQNDFGFPNQKLNTILNAIPLVRFQVTVEREIIMHSLEIPTDAQMIITIGRLTEQKGQRYLLDAFKIVLHTYPNCYLCIVGEGSKLDELRAYTTALGIHSHIRFLGHRHDIADLLASADLFVLPSLWEGLPTTLLEAMAAQKPIIATDIAGTNQLIIDKVNGRTIPPTNATLLASAIDDLLSNPSTACMYGERALQTVQDNFDIARLGADYLNLYGTLLNA